MKNYIIPEKLVEKMVVVEAHQKPLVLLHIMLKMNYTCVLCFTNTIESTHRYAASYFSPPIRVFNVKFLENFLKAVCFKADLY